jgi:predicted DNA-binding antitoxin AbrB/MazE fold protein
MTNSITAIYEEGVLRPLTPLSLPEHARVLIQVEQVSAIEDTSAHRRRVREALTAAGLSTPTPVQPASSNPLSPERREALARAFSAGRPLSELIIEEREGR